MFKHLNERDRCLKKINNCGENGNLEQSFTNTNWTIIFCYFSILLKNAYKLCGKTLSECFMVADIKHNS